MLVVHCRISIRICGRKSICFTSHEDGATVDDFIAFEHPISSALPVAPYSCDVKHKKRTRMT